MNRNAGEKTYVPKYVRVPWVFKEPDDSPWTIQVETQVHIQGLPIFSDIPQIPSIVLF